MKKSCLLKMELMVKVCDEVCNFFSLDDIHVLFFFLSVIEKKKTRKRVSVVASLPSPLSNRFAVFEEEIGDAPKDVVDASGMNLNALVRSHLGNNLH